MFQLKRQHSAEPESIGGSGKSPSAAQAAGESTPPESAESGKPQPDALSSLMSSAFNGEPSVIGSPLKKQRANGDEAQTDRSTLFPSALGDVLGRATADQDKKEAAQQPPPSVKVNNEDEEL